MSSNSFIGFVLLTHQKPKQIRRLINRLNCMFDDPPIVCHHDFSKCELPIDRIPKNVSFVRPHVKTNWGDWSLVEATREGIKLLYSMHNPKWFIFLSGSDYPIKPARKILDDLQNSRFDAHISSKKMVKKQLKTEEEKALYLRYHSITFKYPSIVHLVQSIRERTWITNNIKVKNPKYVRYWVPFSDDFICYMGRQWFSANRKAANHILRGDSWNTKIRHYYKKVHCPDESYFHSILNNADHLKISNQNWRYDDWTGRVSHPKELDVNDLTNLVESEDHFARKFNLHSNPEVLDRLDEIIGYQPNEEGMD